MKTNPETNQQLLQRLRTKIRNHEISEQEVISLLEEKKISPAKSTNRCRFCGKKLISPEPKENKKVSQSTKWESKLAELPKQEQKRIKELEKITQAFNKAMIKH